MPRRTTDKARPARKTGSKTPRRHSKPSGFRGCLNILLTSGAVLLVIVLCAGIPAIVVAYGYFIDELPSPETIASRTTFKTARILDRHGRALYEILDPDGGRRTVVSLADISAPMRAATIAVEDGSFYVNPGFDLRGIARAVWIELTSDEARSGASTITQQLVKNTLLTNEVSFQRKLKEAVLAWEVSRRYSKDQILEMYLNEVYYGNIAYGVEAAAQTYFGKPARDLSLAESALLAGLVQSPADHDPYSNLAAAKKRQTIVLDLMAKQGFIGEQAAAAAKSEPLALRQQSEARSVPLRAPHFALYVRDLVEKTFGRDKLYHSGLEITTTLDLDLQQIAEQAVREHLAKIKSSNVSDAALVAIDPRTGEILAMVGSADFFDDSIAGQVNVALSKRQPGSTLKPFIYLTAFAKGYTPATILQDVPTTFAGGYRPQNHDQKFRGPVRARPALASSLNVPAVLMLQAVGIEAALATMHRAGIADLPDARHYGLAVALGAGEVKLTDLTFAYATLANGGLQVGQPDPDGEKNPNWRAFAPVALRRVVDGNRQSLYQYDAPAGKRMLDEEIAYLITSILSDDKAREATYGRHSFLELSRGAAAKTGTTEEFRDGWTIGYTPDLATGVWVGNADNSPMRDVTGVSGAGYIWRTFMEAALDQMQTKGITLGAFERPASIQELRVCEDTGLLAKPGCPQITELFASNALPATFGPPFASPQSLAAATPMRGTTSSLPTATRAAIAPTASPTMTTTRTATRPAPSTAPPATASSSPKALVSPSATPTSKRSPTVAAPRATATPTPSVKRATPAAVASPS